MRKLIRQIVDGYKSVKLVGQDKGYVVLSGQEPDTKREVLINILPRLLGDDPQIARRFQGLARTIRQLNHPNILSIRKVGEEAGLPYLVTGAVEKAKPLVDKLDQPWAVDTAADVIMQVGEALEHAYKKGLVHGSLTPDDIVVKSNGRVLVTGFGLAELQDLLGVHFAEAASPYLAPERAEGQPANAAADVYSLAAILYSMLTKRQPQVVKGEVLPPSRFNPDVPPAMDAVVVKALAPDPADRYPDVRSFLATFGSVTLAPLAHRTQATGRGVRCPNCGAENQTGKFCRKCGARLEHPPQGAQLSPTRSTAGEPILRTKIEVRNSGLDVGSGVELHETVIARPMPVATGELAAQFPAPLEMPRIDVASMWPAAQEQRLAMPEPPPIPEIDWADIVPPMSEVPSIEGLSFTTEDD